MPYSSFRKALLGTTALVLLSTFSPAVIAESIDGGGVVTVPGDHASPWVVNDDLYVGETSNGTLIVEGAGTVTNTAGSIGQAAGAIGSVTVTGVGSAWINNSLLYVGSAGRGTLNIEGGGKVTSSSGYVGYEQTGTGIVTVSGTGSSWVNNSNLLVGYWGNGTLNITAGGKVSNGSGSIGFDNGFSTSVGIVTVSGAGSAWTNGGNLTVGYEANGTLIISDGGAVTNSSGYIGRNGDAIGKVTVTGTGSNWANDGDLVVGRQASGTLNIEDGGNVTSRYGIVGDVAGSTGDVTVSGADSNGAASTWTNYGDLYVGNSGNGTLSVKNGGKVDNSGQLTVGNTGDATLNIESGGNVTSTGGVIAYLGSSSTVSVSGANSTWENQGTLRVGYIGDGTLTVTGGGAVSSTDGYIGFNPGSAGAVTVSGADIGGSASSWASTGNIYVGNSSDGALTVADGGKVSAGTVSLGVNGQSSGMLNIGAVAGQTAVAAGTLDASTVEFGNGNAKLNFNHTGDTTFAASLLSTGNGAHALNHYAGNTTLTGDSSGFTGATTVSGGKLVVANALGGSASVTTGGSLVIDNVLSGSVEARSAGVVSGSGSIAGNVDLTGGGVLSGASGQTLRIGNNVTMDSTSVLNAALGAPSTTGLFGVGGQLTLDGTLNVSGQAGFGAGIYRIFDAASVVDNGMAVGTIPNGYDGTIQAQTAQVNLILLASGDYLGFWDGGDAALHDNGVVDGGNGAWRADGRNWTQADGALNGPYQPIPTLAIFQGTGGTVTVDNSAGGIAVTGMQFAADGYHIEGGAIALAGDTSGETVIRVGDGTVAGAGMTATVASALTGASTLVKTDHGTLILTGDSSSFTGNTVADTGTLEIAQGGKLGGYDGYIGRAPDSNGTVTISGTGSTWSSSNDLQIGWRGTGTLNIKDGGSVTSGAGTIGSDFSGAGVVTVTGTDSTWAVAGHLDIGRSGKAALTITDNGVVSAATGVALGGYTADSIGTLNIGAAAGQAAVAAGTLNTSKVEFGQGSGTLAFNHTGDTTFAAALSSVGTGTHVLNHYAGNTTLTGYGAPFSGATAVSGGKLVVDASGTLGGSATVTGGSLVVDGTFRGPVEARTAGIVTGSGSIGGNTDLTGGGVLAGAAGQTLRISGNMAMDSSSVVNVALGMPSTAALFEVNNFVNIDGTVGGGNLTLAGTLNVSDQGGFGAGVYRIFDYDGTLDDQGMLVGDTPSGVSADNLSIQTADHGKVNLASTLGAVLSFWDGGDAALYDNGVVDGGNGAWRADGRNWTQADGALNGPYQPIPTLAIFQGAGGTVTVDNSAGDIAVAGMQFTTDGYRIEGGPIALEGSGGRMTINVGDHSIASAGMTATIASELTGASTLVKSDDGTLILTGTNSYTGGTQVAAGTLVGNAGSIRGDIANAGMVVFDQATAASFSGAIAGLGGADGAMVKRGIGELTLAGTSSLDWTIEAGGIKIDAARFGGNALIQSGAGLTFAQTANATYAGVLSGSGAFDLAGSGSVTLTGDSSTFTGMTTVGGGNTLIVGTSAGGKLGGAMTVGAGGLLGGTGTIGTAGSTVTIASGAVHAPGNSIGVQTFLGNYANHGTLRIEATPTAADRIVVAGSVDITGAALDLVLSPADASSWNVFNGPHTIIDKQSAGAVAGSFGPVTRNLLFLDAILDYAGGDGNDVTLELERNDLAFAGVGQTRNQIAIGAAVDALGNTNPVWRSIALSNDPAIVRASFAALSGEIHASAKTAFIEDSRFLRNAVNDRIRAAFGGVGASTGRVVTYGDGGPRAAAATAERLAVWGQGFGSWGKTNGDSNAATLDRSTSGFFIGVDAPVFDTWRLGVVTGYSRTSFDVKDRFSSGLSDNYHVGVYGGTSWGALAFRSGLAYTWHDVDTRRSVAIPGFGDRLSGDYSAATTQVFGELGYGIEAGRLAFEPFANLAYVNLHTGGFAEKGGVAALNGHASTTDMTFTTLGLRASTTFDLNGASLTVRGTLGWRHALSDTAPDATMRFAAGGGPFTIAGVPIAKDAAIVEAGLDYSVSSTATLGVSYGGQFGGGATDQSFKANFNVTF